MSDLRCSARECSEPARWGLRWNNPKIHTAERRKVWLACDGHKESLTSFLDRRGFFKDSVPVGELSPSDG
jgi:hypothetical protein